MTTAVHSPLLRDCRKFTMLERFTCADGKIRFAYVTYERDTEGVPVAVDAVIPPWSKPLEPNR